MLPHVTVAQSSGLAHARGRHSVQRAGACTWQALSPVGWRMHVAVAQSSRLVHARGGLSPAGCCMPSAIAPFSGLAHALGDRSVQRAGACILQAHSRAAGACTWRRPVHPRAMTTCGHSSADLTPHAGRQHARLLPATSCGPATHPDAAYHLVPARPCRGLMERAVEHLVLCNERPANADLAGLAVF
eukprot:363393-Chlamydomonas_euryale.AAC.5